MTISSSVSSDQLIRGALELGAAAAGVVPVSALVAAGLELPPPLAEGSVVVLALEHPAQRPELDWWDGRGGTSGNRQLIRISKGLVQWLKSEHQVDAVDLPYHAERGGVFLKDAAVLAGLGWIGKNNLLITPRLGPRVRLRGLRVALRLADLDRSGPIESDPCAGCDLLCASACPRQALDGGTYSRPRCELQMKADEAEAMRRPSGGPCIKYCRACELACPLGS